MNEVMVTPKAEESRMIPPLEMSVRLAHPAGPTRPVRACRLPARIAVISMFNAGLLLPTPAAAWPTKFTDCVSCHSTDDTTATITTAVNGVLGSTVTVAPGGTFQVDWKWVNATNAAGGYNASTAVMLPANTWTIAPGTANNPAIAGWNTVWDAADGHAWSIANGFAVSQATLLGVTYGYTIDYGGSAWDGDGTGGGKTRNPAADGAGTGGTDLDGVTETMGTDAIITVPVGTTPGVYTVYVLAVGHDGTTKSHIHATITVTVGGGDTVKPTVTAFTATTPVNSNVHIPVTAFTASDNTAVTGYLITATATPPASGAAGWTGTAPTLYTAAAGDTVQLEVEIQPIASPFTNTANCTSGPLVASGTTAQAVCGPLADGRYKWQARGKDSNSNSNSNSNSSAWVQK